MRMRAILAAVAAALIEAPAVHAQVARADALLRAGRLAAAESAYYAASDARPRDPVRRAALGEFLAARGAARVGAVLLEEARQFGGDPAAIARQLVPIYRRLDDYRALAALPSSPLSSAERAQATWLASHPADDALKDSVVLQLSPSPVVLSLGRVELAVGDMRLEADIDPRSAGVVVDQALRARAVARFGERASARVGVLSAVRVGDFVLRNVPVTFAALGRRDRAIIGLDVLARFTPAADPAAHRLVLHASSDLPADSTGAAHPTLTDAQGTRVLLDGHWQQLTAPPVLERLRANGWTLDAYRGELTLR